MPSLDLKRLSSEPNTDIESEIEGIPPSALTPVDVVFLVCRNHRVELVEYLMCAQEGHGQAMAELLNDALLYIFIKGDWDNPYLLQESFYDVEAPALWDSSIGPISISMAEMARFIGNVQRYCPKIWTWIDIRPFVRRYIADEYRRASFSRGCEETRLIR